MSDTVCVHGQFLTLPTLLLCLLVFKALSPHIVVFVVLTQTWGICPAWCLSTIGANGPCRYSQSREHSAGASRQEPLTTTLANSLHGVTPQRAVGGDHMAEKSVASKEICFGDLDNLSAASCPTHPRCVPSTCLLSPPHPCPAPPCLPTLPVLVPPSSL